MHFFISYKMVKKVTTIVQKQKNYVTRRKKWFRALKDYFMSKAEAYLTMTYPINENGFIEMRQSGSDDAGVTSFTISALLGMFNGNNSPTDLRKQYSYYRVAGVRLIVIPSARNCNIATNNDGALGVEMLCVGFGKTTGFSYDENILHGEQRTILNQNERTDVYIKSKNTDWYNTNNVVDGILVCHSSAKGKSLYSPSYGVAVILYVMYKGYCL